MLLPSSNSPPRHQQHHHQQRRRRKLLLTSCIISTTLLLLTSSLLLPNIALVDVLFHTDHNNKNNDIHSTNNSNSSSSIISLEEWIKLQRPATTSSSLTTSSTFDRAILKASNLTNEQLAQLSYDTSCLSNLGHRVYNALYLGGRRHDLLGGEVDGGDGGEREGESDGEGGESRQLLLSFASDNIIIDRQQQQLLGVNNNPNSDDGSNDEERYLRGGNSFPIDERSQTNIDDGNVHNRSSNEGRQNINRKSGEGDVVMQRKTKMMSPKSLLRSSSSDNNNNRKLDESTGGWSTHTGGSDAAFYNDENEDAQFLQQHIEDYVTGEIAGTNAAAAAAAGTLKDEDVASAQQQQQGEEEDEDLYQRMEEVMRVTQSLNEQYGKTSSSSPTTTTTDDLNNNNNNNNPESTDTMTQYSLLSQSNSERQRLLTGYYATWQWYDRSNLASPSNLKLNKVSRINYAFFQSDTDGYIFGTDSWADPNVLNGPYDFSISRDDLLSYCQGGRGRDDGKPTANTMTAEDSSSNT